MHFHNFLISHSFHLFKFTLHKSNRGEGDLGGCDSAGFVQCYGNTQVGELYTVDYEAAASGAGDWLRETWNKTIDMTDATCWSRIWDMTSASRRCSCCRKRVLFSGCCDRWRRVLAARLNMSKLVPMQSGLSRSADSPCVFATPNALFSASSIKATSWDTQAGWRAIVRAIPLSAAPK